MTDNLYPAETIGMPNADQRRSPRKTVLAGGTIFDGDATYVAWIKDISDSGMCLFTKHRPTLGDTLQVTLTGNRIGARKAYEGTVVRVQSSGPGTIVVGVAMMFGLVSDIV